MTESDPKAKWQSVGWYFTEISLATRGLLLLIIIFRHCQAFASADLNICILNQTSNIATVIYFQQQLN